MPDQEVSIRSPGWCFTTAQEPKKTPQAPDPAHFPHENTVVPHIAWLGSSVSSEVLATAVEILATDDFQTVFLIGLLKVSKEGIGIEE